MSYQSEARLEQNLVNQLIKGGYTQIELQDYDSLIANFREKVNEFNKERLQGQELGDAKLNRLVNIVDGKSICYWQN